jgi:xanthine/uracil permease
LIDLQACRFEPGHSLGDTAMPAQILPGQVLSEQVLPVDEVLPARKLFLLGLQHVLVMAASPITSVFLVGKALNFSPALTLNLISATFLVCGLGSLLQSFGPLKFGARLPFIMVPGGAPVIIFLTTAQQTDIQTAVGAVILTALFYFLVLPVFARGLKYFPKAVIGTMLLLVAINLVKVYGGIITGAPNAPNFAAPVNVLRRWRRSASRCCSRACSKASSASFRCCSGCSRALSSRAWPES